MSVSRFVDKNATIEVALSNGDSIHIRQRLTAVEEALLTRSLIRVKFDPEKSQVSTEEGDWHLQHIAIAKAYLTGWTFKGEDGEAVPYSPDLVDRLDSASIREIATAIDKYQASREEESRKNGKRR